MKKSIIIVGSIVFGFGATALHAQSNFEVKENGQTFVCDRMESVQTVLLHEEGKQKKLKKEWDNYLDKHYDVDLKGVGLFKNKDVLTATNVKFDEISNQRVNIVTVYEPISQNRTAMHVYVNGGYGPYKSSYVQGSEEMMNLRSIVKDFVGDYKAEYYTDEIRSTEQNLAKLENRRQEMMEENTELREEIAENEAKIYKLEQENKDLRMKLNHNSYQEDKIQNEISDSEESLNEYKEVE